MQLCNIRGSDPSLEHLPYNEERSLQNLRCRLYLAHLQVEHDSFPNHLRVPYLQIILAGSLGRPTKDPTGIHNHAKYSPDSTLCETK